MIEYHAWATICPDAEQLERGETSVERVVGAVLDAVAARKDYFAIVDAKVINGQGFLWAAGQANHRGSVIQGLLDLFEEVGRLAPDSYGLIHVRDDEDSRGFTNEFRVWRLAQGRLEEFSDVLLSPCIPVIERPMTR